MDSEILSKCIEYIETKKNDMLNHLLYSCYDYNKKTIFSIENNIYDIAIKNNNIDAFNILLYHDIECDNFMEDSSFFNIKKLKYLINKGYKASTRFINLIIKNKGNEGVDLLKLIFQNINYNNEIIINFLFHCKNKLPFSQAELNNIVNKENEKLRNILNTRERRFSISYFDNSIDLPLIIACQNKYNDIIKLLVEYGANVNIVKCDYCREGCCSYRSPLLVIAIRNENESIVKYLIEHGADVNVPCTGHSCDVPDYNYTALGVACEVKNEFIIKCLIDYGADVNEKVCRSNYVCTPLIYACRDENEFLVNYLIENGADINAGIKIYSHGKSKFITPLSIALKERNKSLIKLLIESGAYKNNDDINKLILDINESMLDNEYEYENGYGYMKFNKDIYDIEIKQNFKYINKKNKNKPKNRKNNKKII